ncbi:MAG TPA: TraM recognition domain-containing protein [Chthoniobacterales bacterium]|nr:TraM recognition domain-containing protein [Chthoniobacterales bacterium]
MATVINTWPHDMPLVRFGRYAWTLRDALEGTVIMGQQGAGKTTGSGALLARNFLKAGFGFLVCCRKPDEVDNWIRYATETNRQNDLRIFCSDGDLRFNFIEHESKASELDYLEDLVTLMTDIASIFRVGQEAGSNQHFWLGERSKLVRNTLTLLLLAKEPITIKNIYEVVSSAPRSQEQVQSEDWKKDSLTFSLLLRALQRHGKDDDELRLVDHYFRREAVGFGPLAGTQGTVHAEFSGTFDRLRRGKIGELFGTTTNVTPDDILNGAVLVVNIPTDTWREAGKLAQTIWVQSLLRACNRRPYQAPATRPVVLWQDEFQEYTADSDASFQSGARSKGLIAIRLTQNLGGCYAAYGGPAGQHKVDQLLGVHSTKIWHRNDDPTTNDWASKIIGSDRVTRTSVSESGGTSLSEHDDPLCPPSKFLGLANGGPEHRWTVEAIVAQSGRLFGKDRCFVGEFKQR